jgi:hypothetical protein
MASVNAQRLALSLLIGWSAPSAAQSGGGCDDLRGLPITFGVEWQADIKPLLNETFETGRCTSCHNPGQFDGDLDLTDDGIDALYKLLPPGYVEPGKPISSLLFDKINCALPAYGGARMPFAQNPLTVSEQGLIFDWIAQGARGEVEGEPPIPRDFIFRNGAESLRWY